ncbi:hypothetical protein GOBAR_AA21932 [Gossypium barbadense]|uniref:Uncharacterized protein n=1 Tax=Gossypium barbadense TaxID=3634 RepID=A0A2P5X5Y6_GOSBA|nr:hypothetical protein GOBAR_AA21932 [Gossypium barbadense]
MLQIEELDEWLTFKSRKHDEPKLQQNELNVSPNQLKVGDKVSLDAADYHIDTAKLNEEISLTVLSIFPFGTVEVSHPKFGTFKGCDKWPRSYAMTVGETAKTTRACDMPVPHTRGRHCQNNTGVYMGTRAWEKRTISHRVVQHNQAATRPRHTIV